MANINEVFAGKYLGAVDLDEDIDVTIIGECEAKVTNEGKEETKLCLLFKELDKPFILNKTNAKAIAQVLGSPDTEDWVGQRITLTVATVDSFGKQTEAVRVKLRAPKAAAAMKSMTQRANVNTRPAVEESDIPF
jgi:hypothetical protein